MSVERTANILIVDDRPENLVALEAILEPVGHNVVSASSGEEALRRLLHDDYALILLDVQMPGLDGFETAELIKRRERTKHIPIIFLTAISKEARHVFRGYSAGAVDYLFKPFDPSVLRSKVAVFVELWQKTEQIREQEMRLREQEIAAAVREGHERYRVLAEAMPQLVWHADAGGSADYFNDRWVEYTRQPPETSFGDGWTTFLHPDDLPPTLAAWDSAVLSGDPIQIQYRLRNGDGAYRWQLVRGVATRDDAGAITGWVGTCTDVDDQKRAEQAQAFLLAAGSLLASSLDYDSTLTAVAQAAVPEVADWCTVDILEHEGSLRQLAVAHADPKKVEFVRELRTRYPPDPDAPQGPAQVVRTGKPELMKNIPEAVIEAAARDELHLDLLRELGLRSYMCVPLVTRDRVVGAITFVQAESGRCYDASDLAIAEELARRAATAVDNAQLYREAEERAQAARVLGAVGDGVFLIDGAGVIRLWNRAAELITGKAASEVLGRAAADVLGGWGNVAPRIALADPGEAAARAETFPLEVGGRELWLSVSGVGFDDGAVYAFRNLTDERALEVMKSDFVATVSHELRTPLAAIQGSALTILRPDLNLEDELRDHLLRVIAEESERLAQIVNDLLLASHLDSGRLKIRIESCDARQLAENVLDAARTHLPENVSLELNAQRELPPVAADPGQLRQVLTNLVDNAIKYSPDGGRVELALAPNGRRMRFSVRDRGLGIPRSEHDRVFEKFYRVDPNMTRGIGGTGLGLYICRELVRTMSGRIWLESGEAEGSTFVVEIPLAETTERNGRRVADPSAARA